MVMQKEEDGEFQGESDSEKPWDTSNNNEVLNDLLMHLEMDQCKEASEHVINTFKKTLGSNASQEQDIFVPQTKEEKVISQTKVTVKGKKLKIIIHKDSSASKAPQKGETSVKVTFPDPRPALRNPNVQVGEPSAFWCGYPSGYRKCALKTCWMHHNNSSDEGEPAPK
jgi:hypothetical protein